MKLPCISILFGCLSFLNLQAADPNAEKVANAIHKAATFYRNHLSVGGGYATEWPRDLSEGRVESVSSPTVISIQPHGTTTVGLAMVDAYRATEDPMLLQGAREAASALIWCQLSSGGWRDDFDFALTKDRKYHYRRDLLAGDEDPGKRSTMSTLDDNKTPSALRFLLELAHLPESKDDKTLHDALKFGFDGLLAAQFPNGAWSQQFPGPADPELPVKKAKFPETWPREWPDEKYTGFYTTNDHNLREVMSLLLRAFDLSGEDRYLESARKLGDFFLLAQMPEPQPGWAQQYNTEMEPVWARKFEPPAISSGETLSTVEALLELWAVTGDEKYKTAIPPALDWLERSQLDDGQFARFYELETNRPLYCKAETYEVTYDDSDLPTHYGFKLSDSIARKAERIRKDLERPLEAWQRRRSGPDSADDWAKIARDLRGKVADALESQKDDGYWASGDTIEAGLFVKHVRTLAQYAEAVSKAGEALD